MGSDLIAPKTLQEMKDIGKRMSQQQYTHRSREQVARFFDGTDLVEPGLVRVEEWCPEPESGDTRGSFIWSAVGRKP
jgi:S-adenosyl methyltransferase